MRSPTSPPPRQTVFAAIMAPLSSFSRLPQLLFWIWLHLLQFCASNQTISPEEDAVNKPWRPIPAGRLSVPQAHTFRCLLVPACLAVSAYRGVLPASILLCLTTAAYNDLGFHQHVVLRNACNALGYASFELGATQLAGPSPQLRPALHTNTIPQEAGPSTIPPLSPSQPAASSSSPPYTQPTFATSRATGKREREHSPSLTPMPPAFS